MSLTITNLHCDKCENGIVQLHVAKSIKGDVNISTKGCNCCPNSVGIKGISAIKKVVNPDFKKNEHLADK